MLRLRLGLWQRREPEERPVAVARQPAIKLAQQPRLAQHDGSAVSQALPDEHADQEVAPGLLLALLGLLACCKPLDLRVEPVALLLEFL